MEYHQTFLEYQDSKSLTNLNIAHGTFQYTTCVIPCPSGLIGSHRSSHTFLFLLHSSATRAFARRLNRLGIQLGPGGHTKYHKPSVSRRHCQAHHDIRHGRPTLATSLKQQVPISILTVPSDSDSARPRNCVDQRSCSSVHRLTMRPNRRRQQQAE